MGMSILEKDLPIVSITVPLIVRVISPTVLMISCLLLSILSFIVGRGHLLDLEAYLN